MLDETGPTRNSDPGRSGSGSMQRAQGEASVAFAGARLTGLRQQGCAKALLPRVRGVPEAVFLNTAGGLTSGDRLSYATRSDTRLIATTQAAERVYRADHGSAQVSVRHRVEGTGFLDWLPQETIVFDRADLARETVIDLAPGAGCLMLEAIVLGRAAMGETVRHLRLRDRREIRRDGVPVFLEPFALSGDLLGGEGAAQDGAAQDGAAQDGAGPGADCGAALPKTAGRKAVLDGARAFATMVLCAPGAEEALSPLRAVLGQPGVQAAASAYDGKCVLRVLAADGWPLRRQILAAMSVLRRGGAPPRVWQL